MFNKPFSKIALFVFAFLAITGLCYLINSENISASSGSSIVYIDDGGSMPDVFLSNSVDRKAFASIEAYETEGSGNVITSVSLELWTTTGPSGDSGFVISDLAEIALYYDSNGNNSYDAEDVLISSSDMSDWSTLSNPTRWAKTFSGLNVPISNEFSFSNTNKILITAKASSAEGVLDAIPLKGFNLQVPQAGVVVSSSGTLTNFPVEYPEFLAPVWLGMESAGDFGFPIVISEIQSNGASGVEFIELYNRDTVEFALFEGFSVKYCAGDVQSFDSESWTSLYTVPEGGVTIPGNSFYLLGTSGMTPTPDQTLGVDSLGDASGFVALFAPAGETPMMVELVGYGGIANSDLAEGGQAAPAIPTSGSIERKAFSDSTSLKMYTGGIHATKGNSEDTNYNAGDFVIQATAVPQNSSSTPELSGTSFNAETDTPILINEVLYNTASGEQWIELYNRSDLGVDISGWKVSAKGTVYTFPESSTIPQKSFIVVHWNKTGSNTVTDYYTGDTVSVDMGIYGGDVLLSKADDTIRDYVEYGGSGFASEAGAVSANNWMAGDYVPTCLYGESIGRRSIDGDDSNNSSDWQIFANTSPNSPNMGGDSTAPAKVTNVALVDNDTTANSGLDGRDITITWTPSTIVDYTFDRYELYLLPTTVSLDFDLHKPIDTLYGGQSISSYTGGSFITKDSAGVALANGEYNAYVIAFDFADNKSPTAISPAATLTSEVYSVESDTKAPFITHMPVGQASAGKSSVLVARFEDDLELASAQLVYRVDAGSWTTVDCNQVLNRYTCTIPQQVESAVSYYLKATDTNGNVSYMSASATNDTTPDVLETTIQTAPFIMNITAVAGYQDDGIDVDLSGHIYKSDGNLFAAGEQPKVFLEGTAFGVVTPNDSGLFNFTDDTLPAGSYNLVAFKDGYMDMFVNVFKNDTGINLYMNEGDMQMDFAGGDTDMPFVTWTAPNDGMTGTPIDIYCAGDCSTMTAGDMPIIIGFSKEMNSNTINDLDAANAGSNIYLTPDGGNTRIAGKVKYVYDNGINEARFYSSSHNTLTSGTFYSIVVTQNVTDVNGTSIVGGFMSDGSFSSSFNTMADVSSYNILEEYGTGGAMMPPYIKGTTPYAGAFNVSKNTSIVIEFSEAMDASSINTSTIKLYPVTDSSTWALGSAITGTVSLDQATQTMAILDPISDLTATNGGWYVIKVMGAAKSTTGLWLTDPELGDVNNTIAYESYFQLSQDVAGDTESPTVMGTYPNNGSTGIDVGLGGIEIGFSEPMLATTLTTQNITLKAGTTSITGKVKYDPVSYSAKFVPANAFSANTQYTLTISTGVKDLANNSLSSAYTMSFTTGSADTVAPRAMYANSDDYAVAITFSEPMNMAQQTDVTRWPSSVLNPANYTIQTVYYVDNSGSGTYPTLTSLSNLNGLNFTFDETANTVLIEGFAITGTDLDLRVFIDNVKDKSNNIISNSGDRNIGGNNATQSPVQSSASTYGMLVPGDTYDGDIDMADMGMKMAGAFPMNMMAGQTSTYFVDIPTFKSIPAGGKIILTFPAGFDVSSASKDQYAPINDDINEGGLGTISIASVVGDQASRTITITTAGAATQSIDFLHMDIKGIINSFIPKEFGTSGYTVDIKTMTGAGTVLENITTMPFYIQQSGALTISGTITAPDATTGTMFVYLGSPMTGPMEKQITFTGATSDYSFTNLPQGEYYIFTDSYITLGDNHYIGKTMPDSIILSSSNVDKDITLEKEGASGTAVTVHLKGDFGTDSVDIFASSPSGFRVKTVTPGALADTDYTINLPNGDWMVGIGPAIPMGAMTTYVEMPDWMPPRDISVNINGVNIYENNGTADDGIITFDISTQNSAITVSGTVVDDTGAGIAGAEVYAYQPMGGFGGSNTKTATDGTFTLKIPVLGTYTIGADKAGLPSGREITVDVQNNVSGVTIKLKKPAFTISGKVLNASSQPVAYAPVWAYQPNSYGHAQTTTDSTGSYILYVDAGTWNIEADASGVGWLQYELPVTISTQSVANINLKPSTDSHWYTISGTVSIGGTLQANMPIRAVEYDANGNYLGREYSGMTNSSGAYSINVEGTGTAANKYYRVDIWTAEYGEVGLTTDAVANNPANILVSNTDVTGANITIAGADLKAITIQFSNKEDYSSKEAFVTIEGITYNGSIATPNGFNRSVRIADIAGTNKVINLEPGHYLFFAHIDGLGEYIPSNTGLFDDTKGCIIVPSDIGGVVNFALPDNDDAASTVILNGIVTDGTNPISNAWVWIGNPSTGFNIGMQTASNGAYSLIVPVGSSYRIGAEKPGYMSTEPAQAILTDENSDGIADVPQNIVLTASTLTISGKIYNDVNSNNSYNAGEAVPNGWIYAEEIATGARVQGPVDATGDYSIGVTNGTWRVFGIADGYIDSQYSENGLPIDVIVTSSSVSGKNIKLIADANWVTKTKSKPITPASGGVVDDTTQDTITGKASGTGVKIIVPPNALGSSSSSGNISSQETKAVSATNAMKPFAGKAKSITANDNSGQPITNLSDYINLEMVIYKADIDAQTDVKDFSKLKTLKVGYWDDTLDEWINLPTTRTAQYKATANGEWITYSGTSAVSGFEKFIDDALVNETFTDFVDYKLIFKASTNHLTVFALGTSPDGVKPKAPAGVVQSNGTGTATTITWDAVTQNEDDSAITDLYGYSVYRSTDGTVYNQVNATIVSAGTESYTDTTVAEWTSYYYKITAGDDDNLESDYSSALRVCSNKTVSNGTVAGDCTITCGTGYVLSGNICNLASTSAGGGGGGVVYYPTEEVAEEEEEVIEEEVEEVIEEEVIEEEIIEEEIVEETTTPISTLDTLLSQTSRTQLINMILQILQSRGVTLPETQEKVTIKFTKTLKYGQENEEVKALQECLAKDESIYPQGIISGWYGSLTAQAVSRFQEKFASAILSPWGLTSGTGIVGQTTREKLNDFCK